MIRDVQLIHQLLARYKFVEPVETSARTYLLKSQKRALKYCLKKTGSYSIWFGLVLFILFTAKRFGLSFSLVAGKVIVLVSVAAVIAATSGGIVMIAHSYAKPVSSITEPATSASETPIDQAAQTPETKANENSMPQQAEKYPMEITLYTGKIYHGVIVSRGKNIVVETSQGEVSIPSNKVKLIRRAQ